MKLMTSGAAILAAAMTLSPLNASAQARQGRGMMGMGMGSPDSLRGPGVEMILRQREQLQLTDDQVQKLDQLREDAVKRRTEHQAQMEELRSKVMAGEMKVEELRQVAQSRREASVEVARQQRDRVNTILNDAQKQKLDTWRGEARAFRMGRMMGMRGARGQQGMGMRGAPGQRGMMGRPGFGRGFRGMDGGPGFAPGMRQRPAPMGPGFRRGPGGRQGFGPPDGFGPPAGAVPPDTVGGGHGSGPSA